MLVAILSFFAILIIVDYVWKRKTNQLLKNIPGPLDLPILGSAWLHLSAKPDGSAAHCILYSLEPSELNVNIFDFTELLKLAYYVTTNYGRVVKSWVLHIHALFVSDPKYIQAILSHPTEIKKNRMYSLLDKWLGEGLLTSHGPKWLARRRAITPAFHFQILDNFVNIFDQQAAIFASKLGKNSAEKNTSLEEITSAAMNYTVDVEHFIALATLDVICETAMGVKINAQTDEQCQYVQNLIEYRKVMGALHSFTENIIKERRREMLNNLQAGNNDKHSDKTLETEATSVYGQKKQRMALLDILLSSTIDQQPLTDQDIREEVDTFMFEGHDTTKSGIGFTLFCLSRNPEVQKKLYEELKEVIGVDVSAPLTYNKLMDMKYMDKVIKESLRMYPPVPFIGRQLVQDLYIDLSIFLCYTSIAIKADII
ncbi:cytochrome P450 4d2 [Stomoxys calcitrans]|uniref:cytochrome P450 4d2 n=1 Tax=Stomoxys calcitrans TaxID=35570 RepID=UPI0027E28253|nr:cytochrome P450 4d2 [Stomoxys calcitrans]